MAEDKAASVSDGQKLPWRWLFGIATGSMMLCGWLYLWGYWSYFKVNFLEYISFQDILARSFFGVVPILLIALEMYGLVFIPILFTKLGTRLDAWQAQKGSTPYRPLVAFVVVMSYCALTAFGAAAYAYFTDDMPGSAMIICLGTFPTLGFLFGFVRRPQEAKVQGMWWTIGQVISVVLFCSFMHGRLVAERLRHEEGPLRYVLTTDCDEYIKKSLVEPVYVGRLAGFVFVASKKYDDTLAIPESRVKGIQVYHLNKGSQEQGPSKD